MAVGQRQLGIVRWFSAQRGFGFITIDSTGDDLFVHQTAILSKGYRTLNEGDEVEFSVEIGYDNCARAADVYRVSKKVYSCGNKSTQKKVSYGNMSMQKGAEDDSKLHPDLVPVPCYTCGKMGHFASNCRSGGNYGAYMRGESCYNCGKFGHFARDCYIVISKKKKVATK